MTTKNFDNTSTVYGPVQSWRFGSSLGIDPIFVESTCSFNCIYCQLGNIQNVTNEVKVYVETKKVVHDFLESYSKNKNFDVITYSGSGEPSLALNLGEIIDELRKVAPNQEQIILSNSTTLHHEEVVKNLLKLDRVILKLDAASDEMLQKMNRPAEGITLNSIIEGMKKFRAKFSKPLDIQMMFMPTNFNEVEKLSDILNLIQPDTVQLNTPKRPYPLKWQRDNRGNHLSDAPEGYRKLKVLSKDEANTIEKVLREKTKLNILSVYRE